MEEASGGGIMEETSWREPSWRRHLSGGGIWSRHLDEESWREPSWRETSWREASGGVIMEEASWRKHLEEASGRGIMDEESWRRHHGGGIWRRRWLGLAGLAGLACSIYICKT